MSRVATIALTALLLALAPARAADPIPVVVDTDLAFASDDAMALLALLGSDRAEVLGVTVVTGNDWLEQELVDALRLLEIAGRTDVPVYRGAARPLVNSREEMVRREGLFGETSDGGYKGAFREGGPSPEDRRPPDGRWPRIEPAPGAAAAFLAETLRSRPGEVVVLAIGPLTNVALALARDPALARLARGIAIMGGGIGTPPEFNFWMDPEAARIVLRAPWRRIVLTPLDICEQAPFTPEIARAAAEGDGAVARYFREVHVERATGHDAPPLMYDPIAALALVEPALVRRTETMAVDVEIDHGASYGATLFWRPPRRAPAAVRPVEVQLELDAPAFVELFLRLVRSPARGP